MLAESNTGSTVASSMPMRQEQQQQQQPPASSQPIPPPDSLSGGALASPSLGVGDGETPYATMTDGRSPPGAGIGLAGAGGIDVYGGDDEEAHRHHAVHFDGVAMGHEHLARSERKDDDGMNSYAPSIVSSVLTADGISDPTGFFVVCLVILIGDMPRGVSFPIMWPLVQSIGGDTVTLGYAVAAFNFGRIITSPILGSWSVTYGYTRTLQISVSTLTIGTLLWSQVSNVGVPQFLILAQTVMGFGSGTLGVARAFVAEVTPFRNRTTYMAWLTAMQYAGFTGTMAFGALFSKVFSVEDQATAGMFTLNQYTASSYFMTLVCLCTLVLVSTMFRGRERMKNGATKKKMTKKAIIKDELSSARTLFGLLSVYDACMLGCILLNVSLKGSLASFETLGVAFAEMYFDLSAARAGFIVALCGLFGVVALLSMGQLAKYMKDAQMIMFGVIVMLVGVLSVTNVKEGAFPAWRFVLANFLIYAIGYPIGQTTTIGIFSKIVGRRPQGFLMGWFSSVGSMARMAFPILSGYLARSASMSTVFLVLALILSLAASFTMLANDTLTTLSS